MSDFIDWEEVYGISRNKILARGICGFDKTYFDDALQEGVLVALRYYKSGITQIPRLVGITSKVALRRLIDYKRKDRFELADMDRFFENGDNYEDIYGKYLIEAGATPTQARVLELLSQGVRTNKGLARLLNVTPKSARECRSRIMKWLEGLKINN